jgi:hypothetical protein
MCEDFSTDGILSLAAVKAVDSAGPGCIWNRACLTRAAPAMQGRLPRAQFVTPCACDCQSVLCVSCLFSDVGNPVFPRLDSCVRSGTILLTTTGRTAADARGKVDL